MRALTGLPAGLGLAGGAPLRAMGTILAMVLLLPLAPARRSALVDLNNSSAVHSLGPTSSLLPKQKRWVISVFKGNEPETYASTTSPTVNTVFDVDPVKLVRAHDGHGLTAFLDLGASWGGAGMRIWNLQCDKLFPPASCGPTSWHPTPPVAGCGITMSGLQPEWQQQLRATIQRIGPALRNRSIAGVFLGDELCGTANIPAANFSAVATAAKHLMAQFGGGLVSANEAVRAVNTSAWGPQAGAATSSPASPCYLATIPPAIDLISLDWYAVPVASVRPAGATGNTTAEADLIRGIYSSMLVPKLAAHQRLLLVPGTFADGDLNRSGPLAAQDAAIAAKLEGYWQWMKEDARVVGLNAYHWRNEGAAAGRGVWAPPGDAWLGEGLVSLPLAQAVMRKITAMAGS